MSESELAAKWRLDLLHGAWGVQLIEVDHPLEIYVGSSDLGRPRFQIRSVAKAALPPLSDLVLADNFEAGGHHTYTLTLQDDAYLKVFMVLAEDLVRRTRHAPDEVAALKVAAEVLQQWQQLLRPQRVKRLGLDELRGLVGEVWLVLNHFSRDRSFAEAVLGWQGPLGLPQDFWYVESGFHEAKSAGPSAVTVEISSLEQLDQDDTELLVLRVPQVAEEQPGAFTLVGLLDDLLGRLAAEGQDGAEVDDRLKRLGVDVADAYYAETHFMVESVAAYEVRSEFPALRRSEVPAAVASARYKLTIASLAEHLVSTSVAHMVEEP